MQFESRMFPGHPNTVTKCHQKQERPSTSGSSDKLTEEEAFRKKHPSSRQEATSSFRRQQSPAMSQFIMYLFPKADGLPP